MYQFAHRARLLSVALVSGGVALLGCSSSGSSEGLYMPRYNPAIAEELALQVPTIDCLGSLSAIVVEVVPSGESRDEVMFETPVFVREMKVLSTLKGEPNPTISVVMGFGALGPDERYESPMAQDTTYLVFLEPLIDPKGATVTGSYVPVGGPQGLYLDVEGSSVEFTRFFAGSTDLPERLSHEGARAASVDDVACESVEP